MDDKRKEERAEIIRLSNLEYPSAKDNDKLMGYIREAQSRFCALYYQVLLIYVFSVVQE